METLSIDNCLRAQQRLADAREAEREAAASFDRELQALKRGIETEGATVGDRTRDYVICRHQVLSPTFEKPYADLAARLAGHKGEIILFTYEENTRSLRDELYGSTRCIFSILEGDRLIYERSTEHGLICKFPISTFLDEKGAAVFGTTIHRYEDAPPHASVDAVVYPALEKLLHEESDRELSQFIGSSLYIGSEVVRWIAANRPLLRIQPVRDALQKQLEKAA